MTADAAHKSWWQVFEVIVGVPFFLSLALQLVLPLTLPRWSLAPIIFLVGVSLVFLGFLLVILARLELARHHQPTDPGRPTSKLVTTGVFSVSRNPLYLGGICFVVGGALSISLGWMFVFLLPVLVACHYILIAPEERYLAARFGEEYAIYAASVHRWLGRTRGSG